jgi:serine/threonine protein kinase HipA of HipAB toxin-antitoxin module
LFVTLDVALLDDDDTRYFALAPTLDRVLDPCSKPSDIYRPVRQPYIMAQSYFAKTHATIAPVQEPSIETVMDRTRAAVDAQDAYLDHKDRCALFGFAASRS